MKDKFIKFYFNDLDYYTQMKVADILAAEVCKRMKTPPVDDPCADMVTVCNDLIETLCKSEEEICELDIEEMAIEAGILERR